MKELDIKSTTDKKGKKISLIKVNNGQSVQLFLYEDQEAPNKYIYEWMANRFQTDSNTISSSGNNLAYYRGERKVLIQFPSFYCGYDINVYLNLVKKNLVELFASGESEEHVFNKISWNPDNKKDDEDSLSFILKRTDTTSRVFRAECPILLNEVRWLSKHYKDLPLLVGTKPYLSLYKPRGFIYCKVEGLNDREIKYELFYNEESSGVQTATPFQNDLYIPFEIPKSLLIPQKITPVTVKLRLIEYGINTSEEKQKEQSVTAYLNKIFSKEIFVVGKYELEDVLEDLLTNNLMPVIVGDVNIVANNHMPCKFTEITFGEESESKNLFNEASNSFAQFIFDVVDLPWKVLDGTKKKQKKTYTELDFYKIKPFAIIGGYELKNIDFTIKNFETAKCKVKPKHKSNVFKFDEQEIKLKTSKNDTKQVDGQLNINYDYSLAEQIFSPWNYFLPQNKKQRHYVSIDSCRHSIKLPIDVYPDVQWVFTMKFELHEGKKADSWSKLFTSDVDPNRTGEKKENKFEIGLGINWNDDTKYAGIKVEPLKLGKILTEDPKGIPGVLGGFLKNELYLKFVAWVKSIQEILGFLKMFQDAATFARSLTIDELTNDINSQRNKPQIQIINPKGEMSFSWRAGAHNGNAGMIWEGKWGGTVIGIKATYDMFPLAAKIPQLKVPIAALKFIQWASAGKVKFLFDLVITGQVDLAGKMAKDNAQGKFDSTLEVKASLKLKLVLAGKVKPSVNNKLETRVYGTDVQGGISVSYKFDFEDDGTWGHSEVILNKLEGSVYTEIEVQRKIEGDASDDEESDGITHKGKDVLGEFVFIDEILLYKSEKKQWFN